jgi:hypothetical protein
MSERLSIVKEKVKEQFPNGDVYTGDFIDAMGHLPLQMVISILVTLRMVALRVLEL